MEKTIEVIARAIIIKDNKILLCKKKDVDYWFIPGGHVEFGEKAEETLKREQIEETNSELSNFNFIGVVENAFTENGKFHHEINLTFTAEIEDGEIVSHEDHLDFGWIDLADWEKTKVMPENLKGKITQWFVNKNIFWASQSNLWK